ncbi:uncharacterized protein LOC131663476 [Phymastichus coffea]|uniref:uncharacterized protein LOC131663476 n=1 Tax=Phymastichus coffea TaxID=108790 RepID=UPI00273A99BE|nr:uncharacterized protein LOC131663476 [Phymastichus coffea]
MKRMKGAYGLDQSTFDILKTKTESINSNDVRGIILVDEMKLAKSLSFNRQNLQFEGFTNLGKYTPKHQQGVKGDHALVIMFQPFKGKWVQALECFLSKGSATGTVLHHILLEYIILAKKAGLKVDAVTSDGASWNRNMWEQFGVNEENISTPHVAETDPNSMRRLWFLSDFPHLINCLRNFFLKQGRYDNIWTPDGLVTLNHWYSLLEVENPKSYNMKVNYKIREEHIRPQYYQKMNVAMVFQVTYNFSEYLIKAMNCRTPIDNMKIGNALYKIVEDFIVYLEKWEQKAKDENMEFIPPSTYYVLKISLKATLKICDFLVNTCGFKYLMTARLNQDSLERFFGMMRNYCGSNDHPDSAVFIQTYRLVSIYSLVKPPKESNVTGSDLMKSLTSITDAADINDVEKKQQWDALIDTLLDRGVGMDQLEKVAVKFEEYDYMKCTTSQYVIAYVAGYVARKSARFATVMEVDTNGKKRRLVCSVYTTTLYLDNKELVPNSYKLIQIRNRSALIQPSIQLFNLINILERAISTVINDQQIIYAELLYDVTTKLAELPPLPLLGCKEHNTAFTYKIVAFFLTTRMFFVTKQSNKNDNIEKEVTRERRKLSKLSNVPATETNGVGIVKQPDKIKTKNATKNTRKRKYNCSSIEVEVKPAAKKQRMGKENKFANKLIVNRR